jgi:glycosyltransferase involved in cell wall biosynthesis
MTAPRRLALVIGQLQMGGAERQLFELAVRLDRSRWEPVVVCLSEVAEPFAGRLKARGIAVEVLSRSTHYDPGRAFRLWRLLSRQRIDLAHSFLLAANAYVWAATRPGAAIGAGPPYIASSRLVISPASGWLRLVHQRAFRAAAAVIANSMRVGDFTRNLYDLPSGRIRVIHNGIDVASFLAKAGGVRESVRRELGIPREALVVGSLGRLSPQKNLDLFLEMAGRLVSGEAKGAGGVAGGGLRFVLAGGGPALEDLRTRVARLGLDDRVVFTGPRQDVAQVLSSFDIFVLTSHTEGLPNAVMEAMAAGLPVVATRAGGTEELVEDAVTGHLVELGDGSALSGKVESLLADPEARLRMGQAGLRRVEREFSIERMVEQTVALYDEVLG